MTGVVTARYGKNKHIRSNQVFLVIAFLPYNLNNTDEWVGKHRRENIFGFSGAEDERNM
jgi:hypothetical protein